VGIGPIVRGTAFSQESWIWLRNFLQKLRAQLAQLSIAPQQHDEARCPWMMNAAMEPAAALFRATRFLCKLHFIPPSMLQTL
jgi:hypothetical protein